MSIEPTIPSNPPVAVTFVSRAFDDLTPRELHDLLLLRGDIFVVEQAVCEENDLDGHDPEAMHVLGLDDGGNVVATARLFLDRTPIVVGRIAVREDLRRSGVGAALMHHVAERIGRRDAKMSAQAHLEAWYGRLGWHRVGPVYDEVGIPHVKLVRDAPADA